GTSTGNGSGAIFGESTGASGVPIGVMGTCVSETGRGMFAASNATTGPGIGAYDISYGDNGRATFGWAFSSSGTNYGVYGQTNSASGYGVYSGGDMHVEGNLTGSGSQGGDGAHFFSNGPSVPLEPGDLVEIVGSGDPVLGEIPLILVRRATSANAGAVLGPIAYAVEAHENETPSVHAIDAVESAAEAHPAKFSIHEVSGSVEPG